jgi:hypothetical protein
MQLGSSTSLTHCLGVLGVPWLYPTEINALEMRTKGTLCIQTIVYNPKLTPRRCQLSNGNQLDLRKYHLIEPPCPSRIDKASTSI